MPRSGRDTWASLRQIARERTFREDDFIYLAGDRAGELFLMEEGRIRIFKHSAQRRTLTLNIVEPGDFFGVKALFPRSRHESHAQALTDGMAYAIPARQLEVRMEQNPRLAMTVMENLGRQVQTTERRLGDLALKSVPQRLAAVLLDLAGPAAQRTEPTRLPHRYTHQDLANMINSHRETVTKVVKRFRQAELLSADRQGIVLLDMSGLREMALR